jgi:hypothetical protein
LRFPYGKIKDFRAVQKNFDYLRGLLSHEHIHLSRVGSFQVLNSGDFSIASDIVWDTAIQGNSAMWSSGKNITINKDGLWAIHAYVVFQPNGTVLTSRLCSIFAGGNELKREQHSNPNNGAEADACAVSDLLLLKNGDIITIRGYQNSGAAVSVNANVSVTYIGAR